MNNRKSKNVILRVLSYFKPFILLLLLAAIMAIIINAAAISRPYIIKYIIDTYLVSGSYDEASVTFLGVLFFGLIVVGALLAYLQTLLLTFIGQRIMFNIRQQLFSHIQSLSMRFFDNYSSGRLLTRVTNDVEALNEIFSGVMINLFKDVIMLVGIVWVMFSLNISLALISICSIPAIAVVVVLYRRAARSNFIKMKSMIGRINGFLAENISGMRLVQIFNREKEKFDEFLQLDREFFKSSLREVILNSLCRPVVDIINNLTIAVLVWFCTGKILGGVLEIGVLFAFITYIKQFFEPINEIAEKYTSLQSAMVSTQRIFEILDNDDIEHQVQNCVNVDRFKGHIEFKKVWFAYDGENYVLRDVSFEIMPGQTAAFVGATGSGKTTIISLLARFYDIQKGQILIDGVDIKNYSLKDLRRQISVVLQDVFLFTGDIRSNIRLNNVNLDDERITEAVKVSCADDFICSLSGGYDAQVKERGCTFSAGQKQLISFARAVAFNPSILVLDEATANIDTQTEKAIQSGMANIKEGRTAVIIAHRLSTIRNSDRIIVLHKGRVKEIGTHDELLYKGGIYSNLVFQQNNA